MAALIAFLAPVFQSIGASLREARARRAREIALAELLHMEAARLDDLGISAIDIIGELTVKPAPKRRDGKRRVALPAPVTHAAL